MPEAGGRIILTTGFIMLVAIYGAGKIVPKKSKSTMCKRLADEVRRGAQATSIF